MLNASSRETDRGNVQSGRNGTANLIGRRLQLGSTSGRGTAQTRCPYCPLDKQSPRNIRLIWALLSCRGRHCQYCRSRSHCRCRLVRIPVAIFHLVTVLVPPVFLSLSSSSQFVIGLPPSGYHCRLLLCRYAPALQPTSNCS
jgi:hypothetical protein